MSNFARPMTLKELSIEYAKKQPHQVENLTEEAPILDGIKFEPASHGLWNVYEDVTSIEGPGFVDMNAKLPKMSFDSDLKKMDLSIMGGEMFCPEDKAQMVGGKEKYFNKRTPAFLRAAGQTTEKKIIYDNFIPYAKKNGNIIDGGATGAGYSIVCVRYVPGEVCGLYSPEGFKQGAMLDVRPINGGNLYHNENGVLGYGVRLKGYFGVQLANAKAVSAIVNIDKEHIPTESQMDDLLIAARATAGSTFLYMHPKVLSMLNKYKGDILRTVNGESEINRTFDQWNKIKIVTSYNFLDGRETKTEF